MFKRWLCGPTPPAPVAVAPVEPVVHTLQHKSSEVVVMSHVDGFYLQRVSDCKFLVFGHYSDLHYNRTFLEWRDEPRKKWTGPRMQTYALKIFKLKKEAVVEAIKFEQQFDKDENERIRRLNFVEEKVWR